MMITNSITFTFMFYLCVSMLKQHLLHTYDTCMMYNLFLWTHSLPLLLPSPDHTYERSVAVLMFVGSWSSAALSSEFINLAMRVKGCPARSPAFIEKFNYLLEYLEIPFTKLPYRLKVLQHSANSKAKPMPSRPQYIWLAWKFPKAK